jgi:hypothetical protein
MKMDDLLRTLAEDNSKPRLGLVTQLTLAAAIGTLTSSLILVGSMGVRPDWPAALGSTYVQVKFAFALLLSLTAFYAVMVGAQPDARSWRAALPVAVAPILLLIGVAFELASTPAADWARASMGTHPELCIAIVPTLAIAPLVATIYVMRQSAPASPSRAGALTGLLCGGLGASVYMMRCTDDAPLFVASWYMLAIILTCAIGAFAGRMVLRW